MNVPTSDTTLEREWGRLRRVQLMQLVRAGSEPGLSPLAIELLRAVVEAGEIRASDLANQLFVTKTSISRHVNEMLSERLLTQRPDPSDGRATLLGVSWPGRRALKSERPGALRYCANSAKGGPKVTSRSSPRS